MATNICVLRIERFRGIRSLIWRPSPRTNVILGGGDVGKTTILDAIALLLNPTNSYTLADADYWQRDVEAEFIIEAVISLPDGDSISQHSVMAWPWEWDGQDACLPQVEAPIAGPEARQRSPVYKVRVRGTADLEMVYEIVQPDDTCNSFSVALRRAIGLVRLSGDDRNDRDLRLIQGAGLDRLLADKGLRARLGRDIASDGVEGHLVDMARAKLAQLDELFGVRTLPTRLGLGFIGSAGLSVNALVGLTAENDGVALPLISWGSGTRRLAALAIADALQSAHPITVVDEIERGLEPYRQRRLVETLTAAPSQVMITTHSASVLGAATDAALWYVDATGNIGSLSREKVIRHQTSDPEAFLARLTIVVEGITEFGFLSVLLDRCVAVGWKNHGVHITDGQGNDSVLDLLEAVSDAGLRFAGFADNEGTFPGRWRDLRSRLGDLLFQWPVGSLESQVIPLFAPENLRALIEDPEEERSGMRLRSLADRLELEDKSYEAIAERAGEGLLALIIEAASGNVPDRLADASRSVRRSFKGDASVWFKSEAGGRELAGKVFGLGVWPLLQPQMTPFLNAICQTLGIRDLEDHGR